MSYTLSVIIQLSATCGHHRIIHFNSHNIFIVYTEALTLNKLQIALSLRPCGLLYLQIYMV